MAGKNDPDAIRPPITHQGTIGWMRTNLFSSPLNTLLTLLMLALIGVIAPPLFRWALWESRWFTGPEACREGSGACWSIIASNWRFIIYGFFPPKEQWRPLLAMALLVALLFRSRQREHWKRPLAVAWLAGLTTMGVLLRGGIPGLTSVESSQWGGLPLTLLLAVFGLTAAYPLGVFLALGRQSRLPVIRTVAVLYIELIRGVPLISLLFMSSVVFPLFLPEGVTINTIVRAQVAIILFTAAYIAEVVRGGLQAIPKGQYEAADALGLNYVQTMRLVVLPQALKIVIPPSVSILISAFKDTSLVVIIGLYDLLKTTKTVLSDPRWMGFSAEVYLFVAGLFFVCCFYMSNFSRRLEKELNTGY